MKNEKSSFPQWNKPFADLVDNIVKTTEQISHMVDPATIGGAFVGMSAGEVVGATVGGLVGSVIGPEGTILGASIGSLAGNYIGAKLGSDFVQGQQGENKVHSIVNFVGLKTGENLGTTVGVVSGAALGTIIAGPVGGVIGSIFGDALGGQLGEDASIYIQNRSKPEQKLQTTLPDWIGHTMQDFLGESGTIALGRSIGQTIAGPAGAEIGQTLGTITGKKIQWSQLTSSPER
jgi:hypothetical protein